MLHVICHMLGVKCQVSRVKLFFLQSAGAILWRVCYQQGLPRLVNRPGVAGAALQTPS